MHLRKTLSSFGELFDQPTRLAASLSDQRPTHASVLGQEGIEQVLRMDLRMTRARRHVDGASHRFLGFRSHAIDSHGSSRRTAKVSTTLSFARPRVDRKLGSLPARVVLFGHAVEAIDFERPALPIPKPAGKTTIRLVELAHDHAEIHVVGTFAVSLETKIDEALGITNRPWRSPIRWFIDKLYGWNFDTLPIDPQRTVSGIHFEDIATSLRP
jgi:hypothetical protein